LKAAVGQKLCDSICFWNFSQRNHMNWSNFILARPKFALVH
jgi:hypothetical protein